MIKETSIRELCLNDSTITAAAGILSISLTPFDAAAVGAEQGIIISTATSIFMLNGRAELKARVDYNTRDESVVAATLSQHGSYVHAITDKGNLISVNVGSEKVESVIKVIHFPYMDLNHVHVDRLVKTSP